MKKMIQAIVTSLGVLTVGMLLPATAMASPDDEVTIRMMDFNEHAAEDITSHIALPDGSEQHVREHVDGNDDTEEQSSHDDNERDDDGDREKDHEEDSDRDRESDVEHEIDREHEMEREDEHENEVENGRDDRKDVEHEGRDREEVERDDNHAESDNLEDGAPASDLSGDIPDSGSTLEQGGI